MFSARSNQDASPMLFACSGSTSVGASKLWRGEEGGILLGSAVVVVWYRSSGERVVRARAVSAIS